MGIKADRGFSITYGKSDGSGSVVLLIEDEPSDIRLMEEAFEEVDVSARLAVVTDGVEAFDFFKGRGEHAGAPLPDLVVLDLGLPARSGAQVLQEMRADAELISVPVVVLSSDDDPGTVETAYREGANAYVTKPDNYEEMLVIVEALRDFWLSTAELPRPGADDGTEGTWVVDGERESRQ